MKINFVDLQRQNRIYLKQYTRIFKQILASASFILGHELEAFEKSFAKFCGTKYCIGLNSGTDALEFILKASNIGAGDEVITAPNSYFSSAMVVTKVGAKPVFADIDSHTFNLDPKQVKSKINSKTKAIIPVHLYGQPADMDPIIQLAKKHQLLIVEDCCHAPGAKYKGKLVPVTGLGAFSFYPGKNLGSFGDGGAVVTNSLKLAGQIKQLRNDGAAKKYYHQLIGYKSRLDNLQAAFLLEKLKHLRNWNQARIKHAQIYTALLKNIPQVKTPKVASYSNHVFHLYVIEVTKRNQLQKYLQKKGISTMIHYPIPIHLQPAYKSLGHKSGDFPVTETKARKILSLPMFPELKLSEIRYVVRMIKEFYKHN